MVFGNISGESSDRDELFLNQISKGFGTSVLSCNMKCRFLFSIYIWIDIKECLKKITISTFSLAVWFPFVCLMLMQIVLIVLGNSPSLPAGAGGCWGGRWCYHDKTFADQEAQFQSCHCDTDGKLEENPSLNLFGLLLIFPGTLLPAPQCVKVSLRGISTTESCNGLGWKGP